jgi:hypothetical protein
LGRYLKIALGNQNSRFNPSNLNRQTS